MFFGILGPLDVRDDDGASLTVGGPRPRTLLALLLLDAGHVVTTERLLDGLYGDNPPEGAANALQSQVSRLRRRLPAALLEFHPAGYRLAVDADSVDALRFTRLTGDARRALASGDHHRATALLGEALDLWRGPALADVDASLQIHTHVTRLESTRQAAVEDRIEADLALGRTGGLVAELQALVTSDPLRERLRALLMRALAADGRQAEALRVFEETRELLADELGADPSAELAATHTAILRARPTDPGGARVPVPAQFTSFVGRRDEVARLGELLTNSRLVTVTGPGGVGKTRIAIEAGRDACFVDLAPLAEADEVPGAILAALGLRQTGLLGGHTAPPDPLGRLTSALAVEELLLILDNCEHVVDATARLTGRLLGACPGLRVLATSREALGITGEVLYPLRPLGVEEAAVRLFADRAGAARSGFAVDESNVDAVRRICAALDGLPLAIELAAARLRLLTVEEIAERLDDRFRLLSRGDRTAAPRHQTLRAVVEWSWDLLSAPEQELLGRLSVFTGGATLDAAARIAELPTYEAEELLADLADKSLVDAGRGRYRLLETVRAFSFERLADPAAVRLAHARYFLELARVNEPELRGHGQLLAISTLDAESGNLHAALRWAVTADPALARALVAELSSYWWLRGDRTEGAKAARVLLSTLDEDTDPEEYVLCVAGAAILGGVSPEHFAHAAEFMSHRTGPPSRPFTTVIWAMTAGPGSENFDSAPADHYFADDPWSQALARLGHGMILSFTADSASAEADFTAAHAGFRAAGERWGTMQALDELAKLASQRGDRVRALDLIDEAIALSAELGSIQDSADLYCRRAEELTAMGDLTAAADDYDRALDLGRRGGNAVAMAGAHRGQGEIARLSGEPEHAQSLYAQALGEASTGAFVAELERSRILAGQARLAADAGDLDTARALFGEAIGVSLRQWFPPVSAEAVRGLAAVEAAGDNPTRAAELLGLADALIGAAADESSDEVVPTTATLREALGDKAFTAAYDTGRARGRDEALAELAVGSAE